MIHSSCNRTHRRANAKGTEGIAMIPFSKNLNFIHEYRIYIISSFSFFSSNFSCICSHFLSNAWPYLLKLLLVHACLGVSVCVTYNLLSVFIVAPKYICLELNIWYISAGFSLEKNDSPSFRSYWFLLSIYLWKGPYEIACIHIDIHCYTSFV